ncbi:MAG: hypothetical protein COA79_25950 [Planctomycetota bacterium]|nr:MAG: hypothetical protein COA79_25950 [Planctomycetota bacterium]
MDIFEHQHELLGDYVSIISMCNVLSEKGWELVSISDAHCVFRRLKRRDYSCSIQQGGVNPIHIWTDGNLDLLVKIQIWMRHRKEPFRFVFCPPNTGNRFRWDAFIFTDISYTKKGHLVDNIKQKFLRESP